MSSSKNMASRPPAGKPNPNPDNPESNAESDPADRGDDAVIGFALVASLIVIAGLIAAGGIAAAVLWLISRDPPPVENVAVLLPETRATYAVAPRVDFQDVTQTMGIDFVHQNGAAGQKLLPETMGSGCAFLDYDNDGDPDILLVNSMPWSWDREPQANETLTLYRNDGERFVNVTNEVGLAQSLYGMGVAVGDYDNDGLVDLFVSAVGGNRLFRNTKDGFQDVTDFAGVAGDAASWSTSCGWLDYDNDGRLDLMVLNYVEWSKEIDLAQNFQLVGVGRAYGPPMSFQGTFPYLYHNEGDGTFRDVTEAAGLQVRNPATDRPMAKSMGLGIADLDQDGWLDLIVANDTVQNFCFHNQQDGTFKEIGRLCGVAFDSEGNARGAMGIDIAEPRNDGTAAVAIGNFANEATAFYTAQSKLQFSDSAIANGLGPATRPELTFGLFFFDFDLDGRLDLLGSNGHLEEEINKGQPSQHYAQPPQLFWNAGMGYETEYIRMKAEDCGEQFVRPMVGRGAAYADIDGDGDLDVLMTASGGPPRLLRNQQTLGHHWLRLKLQGKQANRDAIGATVELHLADQVLRRVVMPTRSYLSQVELPLTFGLGEAESVQRIVILWPGGGRQVIENPDVDQEHLVIQR